MQLEVISRKPTSEKRLTPVLFLPGAWHGAWCWDEYFLPYFAKRGYESHALSFRGHGKSEGHERLRWTTAAEHVEDVVQVVSQLHTLPVLVGHLGGGYMIQKYLETHQAKGAVLLASVPPKVGEVIGSLGKIARKYPLAFLQAHLTLNLYHLIGTPQRSRYFFFSADMPEDRLQYYFSRMQGESFRVFLDALFLNPPKPDKVQATPFLVLGAEKDVTTPVTVVEETARVYDTEAKIFPNMAHDMMLEDGWQDVADYIIDWMMERGL